MTEEHDLFSLLPPDLKKDPRAFDSHGDMHKWDHDVCWWLIAHGYESNRFYTVDGDSFGPLVRGVKLRKFGEEQWLLYTYG